MLCLFYILFAYIMLYQIFRHNFLPNSNSVLSDEHMNRQLKLAVPGNNRAFYSASENSKQPTRESRPRSNYLKNVDFYELLNPNREYCYVFNFL